MAPSVRVNSAPALALQKATRCSRGGPCAIGEVGGGIVFALPTTKGNARKKTYEAAPNSWSGGSQVPALEWNQALTASAAYRGGQVTGWRLPSIAELGWLCKQRAAVGGFAPPRYWSSTARGEFYADNYFFNTGRRAEYGKDSAFLVPPVTLRCMGCCESHVGISQSPSAPTAEPGNLPARQSRSAARYCQTGLSMSGALTGMLM